MVYCEVLVDKQPTKLYVDQWLSERLNKWNNTIKRDDDVVICVDGGEGAGKSCFAFQIAKILDPDFVLDKVCMNAAEFKKRVKESKKGDCIVYDEAFTGLSSKGALTEINKILVELMMEMRQLNLKVIICLPTFFLLEKYVALFRARCLFHVYRKRGSRGHWIFFGKKKKKLLYLMGKKFLSYKEPRAEHKGKFTGTWTVNEELYREKKKNTFVNKDRKTKDDRFKNQRDVLCWYLNRKLGISIEQLTDMLFLFGYELDQSNISKDIRHLDSRIFEEIENPPDDNFIERLIFVINERNCIALADKRKKELEDRAIRELEREKRFILKKERIKKGEVPENKALENGINKNIDKNDVISQFIQGD